MDVIAAPATPPGRGAIAIVRVSGEGSTALVDLFYEGRRPLRDEPPRRMALGAIRGADTVLAVRFERGASYTGEESVEIHCHGGTAAAAACMDLLTSAGARVAEPGEFTRRAFLSGRIDLAQAEGVLGVISSRSAEALAASRRTMQGELSSRLRALLDSVTSARAELEVSLDYPDEAETADTGPQIAEAARAASALARECRAGRLLSDGASVVIVGPPNVGKSSLLNALARADRSIVTDAPGTTRDTIDATIVERGIPIRLVDTAGIRPRDGVDAAEAAGIERAEREVSRADVVLAAADATRPGEARGAIERAIGAARGARARVLVINKSDLAASDDAVREARDLEGLAPFDAVVRVSALTRDGVDRLRDAIASMLLGDSGGEAFAASSRTIDALDEARRALDDALAAHAHRDDGAAGAMLAHASDRIARQLGADASEELLDEIFSRFCVGK